MDCSNLLLMELDIKTNLYKGDLGTYIVEDNENIKKFYYDGKFVNVYFDVNEDVEDWEYSAIFDLFPYERFENKGFYVNDVDDDYNPAWIIKFEYIDDREKMQERLDELLEIFQDSLEFTFNEIKDKNEEYK